MRRYFLRFLFTGFILWASALSSQTNAKIIQPANVRTMKGEAASTSKLENKGRPMIIIFWRTDRRNCFQYLQAINEELIDLQTETGVKVVIVSLDSPKTSHEVLPMVMARQWDFESYIDTYQEFKTAMGVVAIPHTFIVNGNREVVWEKQAYAPGQETEVYEIVRKVAKGEKIN